MKRERFAVRAYAALVRLYPRRFRDEYGRLVWESLIRPT